MRIATTGRHADPCTLLYPYTLFYRFDEPRIVVCRIIHQRQDFDACSLVDLL